MTKAAFAPIEIRVARRAAQVTYLVSAPPEALPQVLPRDLDQAWHQARAAALAETDGPALLLRFACGEDPPTDLALTDTDARCWAEAVDAMRGLDTAAGLSLCLRLLALIDLLARERWAGLHVRLHRDGAEIDQDLLREAAMQPLNRDARFDGRSLHAALSRKLPSPAKVPPNPGRPGRPR